MKNLILIFTLFIGSISICYAQNKKLQEVVYLKNGSIIYGTVVEQRPGESLKVQTNDGSIFVYKISEVEKITKEAIQHKNKFASTINNGSGAKKGYKGFAEVGYTIGTGDFGEDRIELNTSHGYQFNPYLYVGGGIGINYYNDIEWYGMPIFANIRTNILDNKIAPFVDLKIGYTGLDIIGFYLATSAGCRIGLGKKTAVNVGLGYTYQKAEGVTCGGFALKAGFEF